MMSATYVLLYLLWGAGVNITVEQNKQLYSRINNYLVASRFVMLHHTAR